MDTTELLKRVRKIEIKTRGLSSHLFAGEYHSAFRGRGMSFSEVREYAYGDDVRLIDWNVTARTGRPHIKVFEEERELTVVLLIDLSASAFFGSTGQMKDELITELCAVLAFSAINNNDKVGVVFFSDRVEQFIPPKKGRRHILRIIRELVNFRPEGKASDISGALRYFNNLVKKRSICFLISDFMAEGYGKALSIVSRRHDLVGIHLYDPLEARLPPVGLIRARDPETGRELILNTWSAQVRRSYEERYQAYFDYFRESFRKAGADHLSIRTDESYVRALHQFFQSRSR